MMNKDRYQAGMGNRRVAAWEALLDSRSRGISGHAVIFQTWRSAAGRVTFFKGKAATADLGLQLFGRRLERHAGMLIYR